MGRPRQVLSEAAKAKRHLSNVDEQNSGLCIESAQEASAEGGEEITAARLMKQLHDNEYRCALSGVELTPSISSLDHSIPLSKGGQHVMSNVKFVHPIINTMKGQMTDEEFIGWCRKVSLWRL